MHHHRIDPSDTGQVIAGLIEVLTPAELAAMIDLAISRLDATAGDPDLEPSGEELDGTAAEDEAGHAWNRWPTGGAGCPIADAPEANGDETDTGNAEDEPLFYYGGERGPGCPISDPGGLEHVYWER